MCLYVRGHTHEKVTAPPQLSIFLTFGFEAETFMFVADRELQSDGGLKLAYDSAASIFHHLYKL